MPKPTIFKGHGTFHIRTCQECGNEQSDKDPVYPNTQSDAFMYRKCKACKSESLDYGSQRIYANGIEVNTYEE